jgi:HEAT repeat protein
MPACLEHLIEDLASDDESTRRFAVEDLGDTQDPQVLQPLFFMLEDESAAVREAVVEALVRIGGEEAVLAVLPALRSDNAPLRNDACVILQRIGEPAIQHLSDLLSDEDKDVRKFAVDVLALIGTGSAHEVIVRALQDTDTNVAVAAAEALGRIGCVDAVGAMARSLRASTWMRCAIAKSLGRIGGADARCILNQLVGDTEDMVVFVATQALGAAGDETSLQYMLHLLVHHNPMIVEAAIAATESIVDRTDPDVWQSLRPLIPVESIVQLTRNAKPQMRRSAVALLGRIGNSDSVGPLAVALAGTQNSDYPEVREAAAAAIVSLAPAHVDAITQLLSDESVSAEGRCELIDVLGRLGRPQAFDMVAGMVEAPDPRVRRVVVRNLAGLDPDRAGAVLCRSLTDRDGHVRAHAARGLGSLLHGQTVAQLVPLCEDPCETVREAAAWAIATIGCEESIDVVNCLAGLLSDPYPDVRLAAAKALAGIASTSSLDVLLSHSLQHDHAWQRDAIEALAGAPPGVAVDETLRQIVHSGSSEMKIEALRSMSVRGCRLGPSDLSEALQSDEPRLRRSAVGVLMHQHSPIVLECLTRLLNKDPDPRVRCECARGLGQFQISRAAEVLADYLQGPATDAVVVIAAIESLACVGGLNVLPVLERWLAHDDPEIAEAALRSMEVIAERVETPHG